MELTYEVTVGRKAGSNLIFTSDKHLFKCSLKYKPSHSLHNCYVKDCPAKIKVVNSHCTYLNANHIHGTQESAYNEFKVTDRVKQRCGNEKKRPREIFDEECEANQTASDSMQFAKRQRSFQAHQQKGIPKNPKTIEEVKDYFEKEEIRARFGKTKHDSPKMFHHSTVITTLFAYVIFASETILEKLPALLSLRIDATFKVVPAGPFKQLLIISVELKGHTFPCFYVLMTKKSQAAYTHLFKKIGETWKMSPVSITTDYEKALRNALKNQYPKAQLIGCWFHFTQALRKKAKRIKGFLQFIKSNDDAKKLFRNFLNLPLIRKDKIVIACAILKKDASRFGTRFTQFINYFEDEWMKKVGPDLFCVYMLKHRTNNLLESYNSNIKKKIPPSGCFFRFVDFLQSEELIKSKDYIITHSGGTQVYPPQKIKYRERDEYILKYQTIFEKGHLSTADFFEKMNQLSEDTDEENESDDEEYDEAEADNLLCAFCNLNQKTTLLEPCNHLKFCGKCVETLMLPNFDNEGNAVTPTCPTCDAIITGSRIVYF